MKRLLMLLALTILPAAAQAQGVFGRFHALVIGNEKYRHLTELKTPKADAEAVAKVLKEQYGFTVDLHVDKTRDEIMLALSDLRRTMTSAEDNLLIYYAGHGYLDKKTDTGYWQPVDAQTDNMVYWIPTDEITRLLKAISTKHVLVVADSCYSGSILRQDSGVKLPKGMELDKWLRRMQAWRSRTALTSGGEEPVADSGGGGHSIFAQLFLEVLQENKGILDGDSLFDKIKRPVALYADQTPSYGNIRKADQVVNVNQGDFLFVPKELQGRGWPEPSRPDDWRSVLQRGDNGQPVVQRIEKKESVRPSMHQQDRRIGQYIDHGDGTITDTKTGLMWKRCSEGLSGVNCEKGKTEEYTWDDAMQRFKNVEYASYADWRLPTIDELKTLVYCSKGKNKEGGSCNEGSERPTINQQAFPNTTQWAYWSGSPVAGYSDYAWLVNFNDGNSNLNRDLNYAVRLVRRGSDFARRGDSGQTVGQRSETIKPVSVWSFSEPVQQAAPQQGDTMTDPTTGIKFVYIPGGKFQMGSPPNEKDRDDDEGPAHEVFVDGFWMGKYEVTQGQWKQIMGENPAKFKKGDKYPVEQVSWEDVQKFIGELNKRAGKKYRLPTEAEWEYAARAGTTKVRYWGDDISCDKAMYDNYSETDNCAEYVRKRGFQNGSTAPVGKYPENDFHLHDMLGNVWEWCADWYDEKYYAECKKHGVTNNPVGPSSGSDRVIRGGGWNIIPRFVRSADRFRFTPVFRDNGLGFRLALPVQQGR